MNPRTNNEQRTTNSGNNNLYLSYLCSGFYPEDKRKKVKINIVGVIIMPPFKEHLETSLNRTNKDYNELHDWIDNDPEMDIKIDRHSLNSLAKNIDYVRATWGDEAVAEFILHVVEDIEFRMGDVFKYFGINPRI
ncbi:hypothetical protein [Desulfosporosinus sp.]|uniref:hypothetical protein n=1 Tax=Desulfosporosinus sp. TaxID=157907 RepID=UPI00262EB27E|nr:hypothetical protein [Desulfosporosinus sp.]